MVRSRLMSTQEEAAQQLTLVIAFDCFVLKLTWTVSLLLIPYMFLREEKNIILYHFATTKASHTLYYLNIS